MRSVAIALAAALLGGCGDATVLRITVEPGVSAPPASLVVTLVGGGLDVPPRTIASPTFPGTIVVHGIPSGLSALCVELDGLDDAGNVVGGASATAMLVAHRTNTLDVTMSNAFEHCTPSAGDGGAADLALPSDGSAGDLATAGDLAPVQICPSGSLFCDDFESGKLDMWTSVGAKLDAGSVTVQSALKAHGTYALSATANGSSGASIYAVAEKDFPPTAPPFALRANVYFPQPLAHYDQVISLYENPTGSTNNFAIGGDNNGYWEVSENESVAGDFVSDMVPTGAGAWHCVELVIDAAGMVDLYIDNHHLVGPWKRTSAVSYSTLLVGVTRSVDPNYTAYIDDVAIGPSRLYCPP